MPDTYTTFHAVTLELAAYAPGLDFAELSALAERWHAAGAITWSPGRGYRITRPTAATYLADEPGDEVWRATLAAANTEPEPGPYVRVEQFLRRTRRSPAGGGWVGEPAAEPDPAAGTVPARRTPAHDPAECMWCRKWSDAHAEPEPAGE